MTTKKKYSTGIRLVICVFLFGITTLQGCESSQGDSQAFIEAGREIEEQRHKVMETTNAETKSVQSVEQTTCPVMGLDIDRSVYTEYKGKKVYFCCPGCIDKFNADPSSYIAKLPQF